jgi:D-3-phosphoglycerate dehydrogenase
VNIDVGAARDHGIKVVNVPGRNASAVAEFTVGAILAETRLITKGHVAMARGEWRGDLYRADRTGEELSQMTVGILGYSHVGQRVVRLLKPFGCRIIVCDPYVKLTVQDQIEGVQQVDLDTLLAESDVVSLHVRLTKETNGMISAARIAAMKDGAYLINTARGALVDEPALVAALKSGKLRGAALDLFASEPLANDELRVLPNVTLTPHIAGASRYVCTFAANVLADDLVRFLAGEPLLYPC